MWQGIAKGHSRSPCPQKNVHSFSLEGLTIFLSAPFSYNYSFCSFLYVKIQSIASLSSCNIIMYYPYDIKLYTILHIKSSHPNFEVIVNVNRHLN